MPAAVLLTISGQVSGVGFRYHTQKKATELGLTGWVRNAPDGNVEILAQGDKLLLEKFIALARRGPPAAVVRSVEISRQTSSESYPSFEIIQ